MISEPISYYSLLTMMIASIALIAVWILSLIAYRKSQSITEPDLVERINHVLPQTQCGECGYMGCKPYATAVAEGDALNKCLPGGVTTIEKLSLLLERPTLPLDGVVKPKAIAYIREAECIGCTKCIQACPVDAIFGSAKHMHTIIASECTGCDLCVDPCPVNCIEMRPIATTLDNWQWTFPASTNSIIATDRMSFDEVTQR